MTNVTITPTSVGATGIIYKITFTAIRTVPANINDPFNAGAILLSAPFGTQFGTNENWQLGGRRPGAVWIPSGRRRP